MTFSERNLLHSRVYLTGLILLSLGMIFSGPVASMSIMLLGANWFAEGNYRERLRTFFHNTSAVLLSLFFLLHVIGLSWSSDMNFGLNDVRIKIPLFVLPFIVSTTPRLSIRNFRLFCAFFVTGVFVTTLISMAVLKGLIPAREVKTVQDIRDISIFVSHIRLSLMICLSIFTLLYFIIKHSAPLARVAASLLLLWFITFLTILESLTGLSILIFVSLVLAITYFNSKRPLLGRTILAGLLAGLVIIGAQVYSIARSFLEVKPITYSSLRTTSPHRNPYMNDTTSAMVENGTYVRLGICWEELRKGWEQKSTIPFGGSDSKGNLVSTTLNRYLASLGFLYKDSAAFATLTPADIQLIESGVTNCRFKRLSSLQARVYETIWEVDVYLKGDNPSGHSMTMRFEFWKTGWHIVQKHWLWGTGTGDVQKSFNEQYLIDHSALEERWHLRGHNQYLAIAIAFGFPGLLLFLASLFYPLLHGKMYRNYFYVVFWMIAMISFLTEDTLETQAGATFFSLFNSVFLFARPQEPEYDPYQSAGK